MRLVFVALAFTLAACPPNEPPQPPPLQPAPLYVPPDGGAVTPITPPITQPTTQPPPPPTHPIDAAPAAPPPRAPGAACATAADCESGVCEGEGCGDGALGHCADKRRMCTMDMVDYCGCDGQTFQSSGSCPGRRYAKRGACAAADGGPPPPAKKHAGDACLAGAECDTGICEGQGCGDDAPGKCANAAKKCTRDRRPFCGCDGQVFMTSGTCPGRRYAHPGKC